MFSQRKLLSKQMSNFSFVASNSPKHNSSSSGDDSSSPSINIPPPPPSPILPPLPFLIFPLPPQVFTLEEVHPLDWNEEEEEDSEELQLKAEDEEYNAFMAALSRHRRRRRSSQLGSESSTLALLTRRSQIPLMILIQRMVKVKGRMKRRTKRRWSIRLKTSPNKTLILGETQMCVGLVLLDLLAINPTAPFFFFLCRQYHWP